MAVLVHYFLAAANPEQAPAISEEISSDQNLTVFDAADSLVPMDLIEASSVSMSVNHLYSD